MSEFGTKLMCRRSAMTGRYEPEPAVRLDRALVPKMLDQGSAGRGNGVGVPSRGHVCSSKLSVLFAFSVGGKEDRIRRTETASPISNVIKSSPTTSGPL